MTIRVAYLINQYPKVSHSFIRREILGIESHDVQVARFAIRDRLSEIVDESDESEFQKTRYVLKAGAFTILTAVLIAILTRFSSFLSSLNLSIKIGRKSERGLLLHFVYLAEACLLFRWFQQEKIQHVHSHFGTNATTVAMLCNSLGGPPYSFTVHGPEEFDKVHAIALPEKLKRAKFVVAITSFCRSQLFRWCSSEYWEKIKIVHCGVDQSFLNQSFTPIPKNNRLVCVGRLSEQKGHLLLLEAAQILSEKGIEFKLVLVGDGELRSQIEVQIQKHHLQDLIEITGWASGDRVRQEILQSMAFILPSFAEGLPVVIMEALALGRPVISTYIAGIPELVESEKCGILVPAGSAYETANAIEKLLSYPIEKLENWGKEGLYRVQARHDIDIEAKKLSDLFRKAIST